jgi:alcohol dehydrogenase class IV
VDTAVHHEFAGLIQFLPTVERILYGANSIEGYLESEVERFTGQRLFLLTPRSLKYQPLFQQVSRILGKRLAASFIAAFEHVPLDVVVKAASTARNCNADLVVALGGGSVIDAAKAVRTCLAASLTTSQLLGSFMESRGALAATLIPQISIPTTLSGSEYTRSFSATDFKAGVKRSYTASAVASRTILYDPAATLATPMPLWLSSGIMAIDHAMEVLCASPAHAVGDAIKLSALMALFTDLPRSKRAPGNLEVRLRCQLGAWLADHSPLRTQSLRATTRALPSHALAYELAAVCRLPYGVSACLTLPACMRWTADGDTAIQARQAEIARILRIAQPDTSDRDASNRLTEKLTALIAELGLPRRFRDVGIDRDQLHTVASRFAQRGASLLTDEAATEDQVISLLETVL